MVTTATAIFAVSTAALTMVLGLFYRFVWIRRLGTERTPTGFGVLLAFALLAGARVAGSSWELLTALAIVAAAAALYWLDDVVELRARLRIVISMVAGAAIGGAFLIGNPQLGLPVAIGICLAAGLLNVVLTNMVNFYDGADLNLATFIALTAGLLLIHAPGEPQWTAVALACLAFILPFAAMNSRPGTIYLGDSGSFAFAGLLTVLAVAFLVNRQAIPPEAAIPAALPAWDVLFTFSIRVAEKHDLLTRHYLHLYHQLQARYSGFGYLLPQVVNTGLCLLAAVLLRMAGLPHLAAVIVAMVVVTIPFYFACRRLFVPGRTACGPQPSR